MDEDRSTATQSPPVEPRRQPPPQFRPQPSPQKPTPPPMEPIISSSGPGHKKPILLTLLAIILIVAAGYGGYAWEHSQATKKESSQQSQITALEDQVSSLQKQLSSKKNTSTSTNVYQGWQDYTTKFNKLSFKYPSDWKVDDQSGQSQFTNQDQVTVTSPDGFTLLFSQAAPPDVSHDQLAVASKSTSFTGQNDYILYYAYGSKSGVANVDPTSLATAVLSTTPSQLTQPTTKSGKSWTIVMNGIKVTAVNADTNDTFQTAKLILKSAAYQ